MIIMLGSQPYWCCDACFKPIPSGGIVLYGTANFRGHLPSARVLCSERCAQQGEATMGGAQRLNWEAFLQALMPQEVSHGE